MSFFCKFSLQGPSVSSQVKQKLQKGNFTHPDDPDNNDFFTAKFYLLRPLL